MTKGKSFRGITEVAYDATAPTFGAEYNSITALGGATFRAGVNHNQASAQLTTHGSVWTTTKVSSESHTTHTNPNFEKNVYVYSPSVIIERVRGSADFAHVISDSPIAYVDRVDQHEQTSKTQKNLSAGMQLLIRGAAGLALACTGAFAGTFSLMGTQAAMVEAGFVTLCSDAAVGLVNNGGDPFKTINGMAKNGATKGETNRCVKL